MQIRSSLTAAVALLALAPGLPAAASADPYQATITKIVRQVDWERYRTSVWQTAALKNLLLTGDTLRTGESAKAELVYGDGSVTRVGSLSSLTLTGDGRRELHLDAGRVWLHITKHSVGMKVITPGAVAAITGTELMVDFDPIKRITQVTVFEGSVNVTGDVGNLVRVLGGTTTLVPFLAPAAPPVPLGERKLQERENIFRPLAVPSSSKQSTTQTTTQAPATSQPDSKQTTGQTKSTGTQSDQAKSSGTSGSAQKSSDKSQGTDSGDKSSAGTKQAEPAAAKQSQTAPDTQQPDQQQPDAQQTAPAAAADHPDPATVPVAGAQDAPKNELKPDLQGQTNTLMDPRVLNGSPTTGEVRVIVK